MFIQNVFLLHLYQFSQTNNVLLFTHKHKNYSSRFASFVCLFRGLVGWIDLNLRDGVTRRRALP